MEQHNIKSSQRSSVVFGGIIASETLVVILLGWFFITEYIEDKFNSREVVEHFAVTTINNEVFNVDAQHRCGLALRQATKQILGSSDPKFTKLLSEDLLTAMIKDATRIINGDIKNRCEIKHLDISLKG